jgi:ferredoxin-NADP reductase
MSASRGELLRVRVVEARYEADAVTSYAMSSTDGIELPSWHPGAHIDVHLPSGLIRQYSLCSEPSQLDHYRIAILRIDHGRGGSVEAHRELRPGAELWVSTPRNTFPLVDAGRYVLVAGGIGITPILPMARKLATRESRWNLIYGARSASAMAFSQVVYDLDPARVRLVPEDVDGRIDLYEIVAAAGDDAALYACGPAPMLDALDQRCASWEPVRLHTERFVASSVNSPSEAALASEFKVVLSRSGRSLTVAPDQSILSAVRAAGFDVPSSCEQGICGTCETRVLGGVPDHRDQLLTEAERAASATMMLCVSRCAAGPLVLDL